MEFDWAEISLCLRLPNSHLWVGTAGFCGVVACSALGWTFLGAFGLRSSSSWGCRGGRVGLGSWAVFVDESTADGGPGDRPVDFD